MNSIKYLFLAPLVALMAISIGSFNFFANAALPDRKTPFPTSETRPKKKIAILVTSQSTIPNMLDGKGKPVPTGYWGEELTIPYNLFLKKGYEVTIISPNGGVPPIDPRSVTPEVSAFLEKNPIQSIKLQEWLDNPDNKPWPNKPANQFDGVFIVGGHGLIWDLADPNTTAGKNAAEFINRHWGAKIAAVCHGPAVLANATQSGYSELAGVRATGFSSFEEYSVEKKYIPGILKALSDSALKGSLQQALIKATGDESRYSYAPQGPYVVIDRSNRYFRTITTGQNPTSSLLTAQALVAEIEEKRVQPTSLLITSVKSFENVSPEEFLKDFVGTLKTDPTTAGVVLTTSPQIRKNNPQIPDAIILTQLPHVTLAPTFDDTKTSLGELAVASTFAVNIDPFQGHHKLEKHGPSLGTGQAYDVFRRYHTPSQIVDRYERTIQNWTMRYVTVFVGKKLKNLNTDDFLYRLEKHIKEAADVFGPQGLLEYIVYVGSDFEVAWMSWIDKRSMERALTSVAGKAVVDGAKLILHPLVWDAVKPQEDLAKHCQAYLIKQDLK